MISVKNQLHREYLTYPFPFLGTIQTCTSPAKRIKLFGHSSIDDLETDWRALEKSSDCSPFQRLSWLIPLYKRIETEGDYSTRKPFLISGYIGNRLALVLPMVIESNIFGNRLKWVGSDISDYNGMVIDEEVASALPKDYFVWIMQHVSEALPDLDAIYLTRNPVSQSGIYLTKTPTIDSWKAEHSSHTLNLKQDWRALYAEIRSRKSRLRLRSKMRALKNKHKIDFRQVKKTPERIQATQQILNWKAGQLMHRGSRNPFGTETSPSTIRQAIFSSLLDGSDSSIKVFGLYCDGKLVAGMLAFVECAKFYYLVSAYAPDVPSKYSVGTQLLVKTLEMASRARLAKYDFLLGDEAYKFDWCDTHVPLANHLIPLTIKGKIYGFGVKLLLAVKKQVMASKLLSGIARQLIKARNLEAETFSHQAKAPSFEPSTAKSKARQAQVYSMLLTDAHMPNERS